MRIKRAFRNIFTNIILQIVLAISGLVIPRFIMIYYGSEMNGLVSSISQFITYAALIEMGIANSSIIALYNPLAKEDWNAVSEVVTSSKKMYLVSAYIYSIIIIAIAALYPLLYTGRLSYQFIFELVLCIGALNAIDYFILGKYKVLLIADQKYYILNIARTFATILTIVCSIILLVQGVNLVYVKGVAVIAHLVETLLVMVYVEGKYKWVNYHGKKIIKIPQRWNALVHQLCATITYNTDIVVLTLCLPGHSLLEISVYSVYAMILLLLTNLTASFTTGINASFGNMLAKKEYDKVRIIFDAYEYIFFTILFILYSCFATLIIPFVSCYTKGMNDVNYIRLTVGILFALNGLIAQLKDASGVIINAAGKYKETQRYAIEEAVSNIAISVLLVGKMGITGVLIGTLISHIWMDYRMISYMEKNIICGIGYVTVSRIIRNSIIYILLVAAEICCIRYITSWLEWIITAVIVGVINLVSFGVINLLFEKKMAVFLMEKLRRYRTNGE